MKKKILLPLLLTITLLLLTACGSGTKTAETKDETTKKMTTTVPVILNQTEYLLYQNVFYNGYADSNTGAVTKNGVYAVIQDAFHNVTRHYVWGYLDNTLCCDWQWEFVPTEGTQLPSPGSEIRVEGNFTKGTDALDGYWIQDAKVTVETEFAGKTADINMLTMSDTLERVQMTNIVYRKESFEGKTFTAYGRIAANDYLEDPYYNGSWRITIHPVSETPAIGTLVRLEGLISNGELGESKLEEIK